jgi:bifunctional non-homologous end joining protein LigD
LRLHGEDLRALPLEERRARLRRALRGASKGLRFSEHLEGDGEAI